MILLAEEDTASPKNQSKVQYSNFSAIAADNPHAWFRDPLSAKAIREPSDKNAMIAFPYTKRCMSQWNVNQAVAVIVCSLAKARELGLNEQQWIFPLSGVQSRHVINLVQKKQLHTHLGTVLSGQRAMELAGCKPAELTAADVYSCFPSAIMAAANDLQIPAQLPLTVTGGMAFAGGPFNHGALDSIARMAEVLQEKKPQSAATGLVSNISGMFGKQACCLLSTTAIPGGFAFDDITNTIAERDPVIAIDENYTGPATVVAYSVMYNKNRISHSIAYCDTPAGKRTVVRSNDKKLAELMTRAEFVGRQIEVKADGSFNPIVGLTNNS